MITVTTREAEYDVEMYLCRQNAKSEIELMFNSKGIETFDPTAVVEVDSDGDWSVHSIQFCCDMGKGIAEWGRSSLMFRHAKRLIRQ